MACEVFLSLIEQAIPRLILRSFFCEHTRKSPLIGRHDFIQMYQVAWGRSRAILLIVTDVSSPISTCRDTDVIFISQDSNMSKTKKKCFRYHFYIGSSELDLCNCDCSNHVSYGIRVNTISRSGGMYIINFCVGWRVGVSAIKEKGLGCFRGFKF